MTEWQIERAQYIAKRVDEYLDAILSGGDLESYLICIEDWKRCAEMFGVLDLVEEILDRKNKKEMDEAVREAERRLAESKKTK